MSPKQQTNSLITHLKPKSPISEAYRSIRTNVRFSNLDRELRSVLVTSSEPGEGKSTTACNFAVVSAQADTQVLILDADLRKPQIHQRLRVSNLNGVSTVLTKSCSLEQAIQSSDINNLFVLPSGPIPPNPSEMLSSRAMRELLEECKAKFDMVIIDSPPILPVTDSLILTEIVDGTILVVDAHQTNRKAAARATEQLRHAQARILGVILNRISKKESDGYGYHSYYGEASATQA